MITSQSLFIPVRGLRYHVTTWGAPDAPKLFLLHGWMDVGASFQFLVDALGGDYQVIAPDWRGFGRSEWQRDGYWFADYLADLDCLLTYFSPNAPVNLVGHSLGGNVASLYAGVRPARVARLISLEGFGLPDEAADRAPEKVAKWLDALANPPAFAPYRDLSAVADRLQKNNPRLPRDKADFLAAHWAEIAPDGSARLVSDPRHKLPFPTVYRREEAEAIWRRVTAPTLWIAALESKIPRWLGMDGDIDAALRARSSVFANARAVCVADAGHMLHHDQPEAVASAIESFVAA